MHSNCFFAIFFFAPSRNVFRHSLANSFPVGPRFDPLSVDSHPSSTRASNNRFGSRHAVDVFLRENGIDPSSRLKPQDAALADATPDVILRHFAALFGGILFHERPISRVRNILCVDPVVQPYAPSSPGEPGVLFIAPGTPLHEDKHPSFHLFINISPRETHRVERQYRYAGDYIKVPVACSTVEVEDWLSLPIRVSIVSLPHPHNKKGGIPRKDTFFLTLPSSPSVPCRMVMAHFQLNDARCACHPCQDSHTQ
jgi:hypothetical protein